MTQRIKVNDVDYIFLDDSSGLPAIDPGGADSGAPLIVDPTTNQAVWAQGQNVMYIDFIAQHVYHGLFWIPGQNQLNPADGTTVWKSTDGMFWDAWAQGDPWDSSGYIISDGYGGDHALLWSGTSGNINFVSGGAPYILTYTSDQNPPAGVFSHVAVGIIGDAYGNRWIITWCNGVVIGRTGIPVSGGNPIPRATIPINEGGGSLFVGGSDHSNFKGYIAQVRAWDNVLPLTLQGFLGNFIPQRNFTADDGNGVAAQFLANYVGPDAVAYPDMSSGYNSNVGTALRTHPGVPFYAGAGLEMGPVYGPCTSYPLPSGKFVVNTPFSKNYIQTAPDRGYTPKTPPGGCKIFDSFSRPDQEYAHLNTLNIGSTEGGSLGPLVWTTAILNGAASGFPQSVGLFNRSLTSYWAYAFAMVQNNSSDMTLSATRVAGAGWPSPGSSGGSISMVFRMVSNTSGYIVTKGNTFGLNGSIVDDYIYLIRYDNGVDGAILGSFSDSPTSTWTVLSVVCSGSSIIVKTDGTTVISATDSTYAGHGVGLAPNSSGQVHDFTVY